MGGGNAAADGIIEQKGDAVAGKDSEAQSGHIGDKPVRLNNSALSGVGHHIGSGNGTDSIAVDLMIFHQGGYAGPNGGAEAGEIFPHMLPAVPPVGD